jgi:uncharacterized protein (TIRG00374 family)
VTTSHSRLPLLALKILVPLGIVVWIVHDLDFAATAAILKTFPPALFLLAIVIQMTMQSLHAARWKVLTGRADIPYRDFLGFVSLGYILAIVSPSALVSDSANAWLMGKRNQSVVLSISAMVAGRLLGFVAMLLFFMVALPSHVWIFKLPVFQSADAEALWFLTAIPVVALLVVLVVRSRPAWLEKFFARVQKVWEQAGQVFSRRRAVATGVALSLVLQGLQLTLPWLGFYAMGIPVRFSDVMFLVPLATLITLVPGLGQAGIREGIIFILFSALPGVTREHIVASFGYSYALFAVMGLLNLGFAVWALRLHRSGRKLYRWFFPSGDRNLS